MRALLLVIASCLCLAACATTPKAAQEIPWDQVKSTIPQEHALLYVVRPANFSGSANTYKISINGAHVSDLRTGYYFSYPVPSGDVTISAKAAPSIMNFGLALAMMGTPSLHIKTVAGEVYFVEVGVDMAGGPTLRQANPEKAKPQVEKAQKNEASTGK